MRALFLLAALLLAVRLPAAAPPAACFDGARAYTRLKELCAFGPRVPGSEAARKSGDWLIAQLRALGDELTVLPFPVKVRAAHPLAQRKPALARSGLTMRNIVCRFRPAAKRRLLLMAHWDCRPFADMERDKTLRQRPVPGANDAGSGVAVLLELARCLKMKAPAMGVDIVLVDGEDFGPQGHLEEYFLGSRAYAASLAAPLPEAGVLLDMVGDRDLRIPWEPYSRQAAPELMERVWSLAEGLGYGQVFVNEPGPAVQDDHLQLIRRGVPMIDLIDFDYPRWHTTRDTPEACSAASLEAVGRVVEALIREGW